MQQSVEPWCVAAGRGRREASAQGGPPGAGSSPPAGPPRQYALITNGGEGPHYEPWPELRTLVTAQYKLQYYVQEQHIELDDLRNDPQELEPRDSRAYPTVVRELLDTLIDAGSAASVWGEQTGGW